jgi:hypothetical protein
MFEISAQKKKKPYVGKIEKNRERYLSLQGYSPEGL